VRRKKMLFGIIMNKYNHSSLKILGDNVKQQGKIMIEGESSRRKKYDQMGCRNDEMQKKTMV